MPLNRENQMTKAITVFQAFDKHFPAMKRKLTVHFFLLSHSSCWLMVSYFYLDAFCHPFTDEDIRLAKTLRTLKKCLSKRGIEQPGTQHGKDDSEANFDRSGMFLQKLGQVFGCRPEIGKHKDHHQRQDE